MSSSSQSSTEDESEVSCYDESSVTSESSTVQSETSSFFVRQTHHGLFCISWTLEFFTDEHSFCKEFKVCGSDINQSYVISCLPKKYWIEGGPRRRRIAEWKLRFGLKHLPAASYTKLEDEKHEPPPFGSEQPLLYFWQSRDGENEDKHGEFRSGLWTLSAFNVKKLPTIVTLWMDFGNSTVGERGFKKGEKLVVHYSFWPTDEFI